MEHALAPDFGLLTTALPDAGPSTGVDVVVFVDAGAVFVSAAPDVGGGVVSDEVAAPAVAAVAASLRTHVPLTQRPPPSFANGSGPAQLPLSTLRAGVLVEDERVCELVLPTFDVDDAPSVPGTIGMDRD